MYIERFGQIINKIKECDPSKVDAYFSFLENSSEDFPDYINKVAMGEMQISIARVRYMGSPEEFQEVVSQADKARRNAHLSLVASINGINRLAKMIGAEPFFTETVKEGLNTVTYGIDKPLDEERDCRRMAAKCAKIFVDELYFQGRHRTTERPEDRDVAYILSQEQRQLPSGSIIDLAQQVLSDNEQMSVPSGAEEYYNIEEL